MTYNSYEVLIIIVLTISLVVKVPVRLFNIISLICLTILFANFDLITYDITVWESIIKILCVIIGIVIINIDRSNVLDNSNVLMLCIILASMVMISTTNLLALYLCVELQSLSIFILIARRREIITKIEASLKYFVLSSISSGLFLLGSSIIFLKTGGCELSSITSNLFNSEKSLIIVALLFKLAASPFHFWSPDVYQGSDNKALAVLGTLPKISIFGIFMLLLPNAKLLLLATTLSLITGSIGAINQVKIKRLLAYSGILAMGFILLGMNSSTYGGLESSLTYIIIYIVTFLGIILITEYVIKEKSTIIEFSNFLGSNAPIIGAFVIFLFSMAGVPPLGGFLAKWFVISSAMNSNFLLLSILSIICAMIAGVYYLRLVKIAYFQQDKLFLIWRKIILKDRNVSYSHGIVLGTILYSISFFLISPQIVQELIHFGVLSTF
uniref:NADH:ubiquinone reductase (H(+)-translocating) n=1 Tax=Stomolophus sp. CG-2019 TaxID=2576781 RepID=A0A4P9HL62_9CNID|nr:NADH dehydrogenase subunit 2 [Stomolophus sp. CG-2019]